MNDANTAATEGGATFVAQTPATRSEIEPSGDDFTAGLTAKETELGARLAVRIPQRQPDHLGIEPLLPACIFRTPITREVPSPTGASNRRTEYTFLVVTGNQTYALRTFDDPNDPSIHALKLQQHNLPALQQAIEQAVVSKTGTLPLPESTDNYTEYSGVTPKDANGDPALAFIAYDQRFRRQRSQWMNLEPIEQPQIDAIVQASVAEAQKSLAEQPVEQPPTVEQTASPQVEAPPVETPSPSVHKALESIEPQEI